MVRQNSTLTLLAAFLSFLFSVYLWFSGAREEGMFVGLWVPSILAAGVYLNPVTKENHNGF